MIGCSGGRGAAGGRLRTSVYTHTHTHTHIGLNTAGLCRLLRTDTYSALCSAHTHTGTLTRGLLLLPRLLCLLRVAKDTFSPCILARALPASEPLWVTRSRRGRAAALPSAAPPMLSLLRNDASVFVSLLVLRDAALVEGSCFLTFWTPLAVAVAKAASVTHTHTHTHTHITTCTDKHIDRVAVACVCRRLQHSQLRGSGPCVCVCVCVTLTHGQLRRPAPSLDPHTLAALKRARSGKALCVCDRVRCAAHTPFLGVPSKHIVRDDHNTRTPASRTFKFKHKFKSQMPQTQTC